MPRERSITLYSRTASAGCRISLLKEPQMDHLVLTVIAEDQPGLVWYGSEEIVDEVDQIQVD